jgi:hypothetical protein
MLLRPAYLSQKLHRPLPTKDGGTLRTVLDARTYMLRLSKDRERNARWQRAAELLLAEADVAAFKAVELALSMMPYLTLRRWHEVLTKKPNQPEEDGERGTQCADLSILPRIQEP